MITHPKVIIRVASDRIITPRRENRGWVLAKLAETLKPLTVFHVLLAAAKVEVLQRKQTQAGRRPDVFIMGNVHYT